MKWMAIAAVAMAWACTTAQAQDRGPILATQYPSIQAAIDANPGSVITVPPGTYEIASKLRIAANGGGICGHARIIQSNPAEPILEIEHASDVRIADLTLTRAASDQIATAPGLLVRDCTDITVDGVTVCDNHARDASVELRQTTRCTVRDCAIRDYKCIAVDDRTESPLYGYAFNCIDGTGILVADSVGAVVSGNRIIETKLFPAQEIKDKFNLGKLTEGRRPSTPGGALAKEAFENGAVRNWHQGSAIIVTSPETTHHTTLTGNYIENAAQGIDLHSDNVICTNNTVNHGMMGVKATHGARSLIISGNMLTHIDLWGILLNPGAISHPAEAASDGQPARTANVDGGTIIANNIIVDYGRGHEYWNWGGASKDGGSSYAIAFLEGQLPTNPPVSDVLVQGNIVYDTGRDAEVLDGKPVVTPPRYRYAVYITAAEGEKAPTCPRGLHFSGNIFHPGSSGVSNIPLQP